MVVTNEEEIWQRACMYHDPIGALRRGFALDELRYGINFRMTEIQGAIALVQLRKLAALLADMRDRQKMLKAGMADIAKRKGITFRAEVTRTATQPSALFSLPKVPKWPKM